MVTVTFRALSRRRLQLFTDSQLQQVEAYMLAHLHSIQEQVRPYPPPKAGSKYVRTGNLFNAWQTPVVRSTSDRLVGAFSLTITGDARGRQYAKWVHGDAQGRYQLGYHANTGWKRLADFLDRPGYRRGLQAIMSTLRIQ